MTLLNKIVKERKERCEPDAHQVRERNDIILNESKIREEADAKLVQYQEEYRTVLYVKHLAEEKKISVEDCLNAMPPGFQEKYNSDFAKIKTYLDAIKEGNDEIVVNILASAYQDQTIVQIPVFAEDKQKMVLPGALYGAALIAVTKTSKEVGGDLYETDSKGLDVIEIPIYHADARKTLKSLEQHLRQADFSDLEKGNMKVNANLALLTESAIDLSKKPRVYRPRSATPKNKPAKKAEPKATLATPAEGTLTLYDAAKMWRDHETEKGTLNGNEHNYRLKLARRAKEGRAMTEADGTITQEHLEDFLKYTDLKKNMAAKIAKGENRVNLETAAELLGIARDTIPKYVRAEKIHVNANGEVSLYSLRNFTRDYMLRSGQWKPFKKDAQKEKKTKKKAKNKQRKKRGTVSRTPVMPITKARENYLTPTDAAEAFDASYFQLLDMAKTGTFPAYYEKDKRQHLYDKKDLKKHLKKKK
ncbi:hypothetical protein ACFL96_14855 [Thermoproteota archaeon]